jgi:hypothetical protein
MEGHNAFHAAQLIPSDIPSAQELCLDVEKLRAARLPQLNRVVHDQKDHGPFGGPFTHTESSIENEAK